MMLMRTQEQPFHKAICELDGMEIELIVSELQKSVVEAKLEKKELHAICLELVISKLQNAKKNFHSEWTGYLINGQKEKELI